MKPTPLLLALLLCGCCPQPTPTLHPRLAPHGGYVEIPEANLRVAVEAGWVAGKYGVDEKEVEDRIAAIYFQPAPATTASKATP